MLLVQTSFGDTHTAEEIAHQLVSEHLAACASVMPEMRSFYHWNGALESASERLVIFKTTQERYPAFEARLRELHPYELPEIVAIPVTQGLPEYLAWVAAETRRPIGS